MPPEPTPIKIVTSTLLDPQPNRRSKSAESLLACGHTAITRADERFRGYTFCRTCMITAAQATPAPDPTHRQPA